MENLQPKLRFPEFKEDWIQKPLKEIGKIIGGGTPSTSVESYWEGNIPWISSSDIFNNNINNISVSKYISEDAIKNSATKLIKKNSLLVVSRVGVGKFAVNNFDLCTSQDFANIIVDDNKSNTKYLAYSLLSKRSVLLNISQGTSIKGFTNNDLYNLKLTLPTLQEQTKIADFLGAVDKQLDILNQKKGKLNTYKKGVMQQLFAQQLRFKDDNGNNYPDWQEKTLGEVLKYTQPNKFIVKSTDYNNSYNIPVLTAGKSFLLGYTNETDNIYKIIPCIIFDDFTTSSQFVDFEFKIKSSAMKILNTIGNDNIKFLFELINTIHFATGDEHKRYWISEYSKLKLSIPTIEEQTKIANFLSAIDNQIQAVENQITKTETYKKGLLQQMFV